MRVRAFAVRSVRGWACSLLLATIAGWGCTDHSIAGTAAPPPEALQSAGLSCIGTCLESDDPINAADPGYISFQTPDPGPRGGFPETSIGGTFAEPALVYARATGIVSKTFADSWVWPSNVRGTASHPLDPNGRVWGGAFQCVGNLEIYYYKPNGAPVANAFCTRNNTNLINSPARSPFDTTFVVEGSNGKVRRLNSQDTGPNCGYLGYPECFTFAGKQTIELVPYRKTLVVNASRDSVGRGDTVTFTASATGGSVTIRSWRWASTTGATHAVPCSTMSPTCLYVPPDSGRMYVVAKVGSNSFVEQARSVVVRVYINCPTGDVLVDNPVVRDMLKALERLTKSTNPPKEMAGYVFTLPDGSQTFVIDSTNPLNNCRKSQFRPQFQPAGSVPVVGAHSHPGNAGDRAPCVPGGTYRNGPHGGIASPNDWAYVYNGIPQIIISPSRIARINPPPSGGWNRTTEVEGTLVRIPDKTQFNANYTEFPRGGSCVRP